MIGITEWEHNVPLLKNYMKRNNILSAELAARCNSTTFTFENVMSGVSYGMETFWENLSKITGEKFEINCEEKSEKARPKTKTKIIIDYLAQHLRAYGNVFLTKKDAKKLGGKSNVIEYLRKEGYEISIHTNNDDDYICELKL